MLRGRESAGAAQVLLSTAGFYLLCKTAALKPYITSRFLPLFPPSPASPAAHTPVRSPVSEVAAILVRFLRNKDRRKNSVPLNKKGPYMKRRPGTTAHTSERRSKSDIVVARASAATWVVAFSRHVIPGALFRTKEAALVYAATIAAAAGLRTPAVTVLG